MSSDESPHPEIMNRQKFKCATDRLKYGPYEQDQYILQTFAAIAEDRPQMFGEHPEYRPRIGKINYDCESKNLDSNCRITRSSIDEKTSHVQARMNDELEDNEFAEKYNLLAHLSHEADVSGKVVWRNVSSGAGALLHVDTVDSITHCYKESKVWICFGYKEYVQLGEPKFTTWQDYLQLESFQWFVLKEGDTIVLPGTYYHATCTVGSGTNTSTTQSLLTYVSLPRLIHMWNQKKRYQPENFGRFPTLMRKKARSRLDPRLAREAIKLAKGITEPNRTEEGEEFPLVQKVRVAFDEVLSS